MTEDLDELRAEIALLRHEISILRAELSKQRPIAEWELRERNIDYYGN